MTKQEWLAGLVESRIVSGLYSEDEIKTYERQLELRYSGWSEEQFQDAMKELGR